MTAGLLPERFIFDSKPFLFDRVKKHLSNEASLKVSSMSHRLVDGAECRQPQVADIKSMSGLATSVFGQGRAGGRACRGLFLAALSTLSSKKARRALSGNR